MTVFIQTHPHFLLDNRGGLFEDGVASFDPGVLNPGQYHRAQASRPALFVLALTGTECYAGWYAEETRVVNKLNAFESVEGTISCGAMMRRTLDTLSVVEKLDTVLYQSFCCELLDRVRRSSLVELEVPSYGFES